MPELPEVETLRQDLAREVVGRKIKAVAVANGRSVRRHASAKHFRALLESRWASKGGEPISELIGGTIDAWEVADGRKPANCAALFRALSDIRKRESQARSNETLSQRLPSVNDLRPKER